MRFFPIFLNVDAKRIVVSGAGETAVAKLRLILKTDAKIVVYGENPDKQIQAWADLGKLTLHARRIDDGDALCAALLYAANDDDAEDQRAADIGRRAGALVNLVDNLEDSQFITPAIVDRDPVTIAIGTEGAAPVLARRIKADLEERLPVSLGRLAKIGQSFRARAAMIPQGRKRRDFWSRFYGGAGQKALAKGGDAAVRETLDTLLTDQIERRGSDGHVSFVGAGPGDPDLMTVKARRLLHEADVVLHDRLVPGPIIELARREAIIIETGKTGYGPSWNQDDISALIIEHAAKGAHVVRLKSGDPAIYGRLDEEIEVLNGAGIQYEIIPGITSASAAAADVGVSLTRRGRNASLRILTGRDMDGFAEHDWRTLTKPGSTAAIYMGVRAAHFLQTRLTTHGAQGSTPVTVVENASRPDRKIIPTTLEELTVSLARHPVSGPAILLYGIAAPECSTVAVEALVQDVAKPNQDAVKPIHANAGAH